MHTITICPRCKIDFMYHSTDYHLKKDVTIVDEVGNNEITTIVICHDCENVEKNLNSISLEYDLSNYESYKRDVLYYWQNANINELQADGLITVDVEERREDGSLSYQSYRFLTEEEFNGRFFKIMEKLTIDNVERLVFDYPTKNSVGFTAYELNTFLVKYEVDIMDFFEKLGIGHTCMVIDGLIIRYHCDIITGLRCVIENRDIKFDEWD